MNTKKNQRRNPTRKSRGATPDAVSETTRERILDGILKKKKSQIEAREELMKESREKFLTES